MLFGTAKTCRSRLTLARATLGPPFCAKINVPTSRPMQGFGAAIRSCPRRNMPTDSATSQREGGTGGSIALGK